MAKKKSTRKKAVSKPISKPKKILSSRQKRHKAVQKAISNYNKQQKAGNKLDRKQFWEAYRIAKKETEKDPVRGLIGKISKQNWKARLASAKGAPLPPPQDPSKRAVPFPPQLLEVICWFDIIDEIELFGQGYFQAADILIFRFNVGGQTIGIAGLDSISFIWDDYRTKGAVVMYAELKAYNNFGDVVQNYSPPPCFIYNPAESNPSEGVFIWDLDPDGIPSLTGASVRAAKSTQKNVKTIEDLVSGMDEESLREIIRKSQEELAKKEAENKGKKAIKKKGKK